MARTTAVLNVTQLVGLKISHTDKKPRVEAVFISHHKAMFFETELTFLYVFLVKTATKYWIY